MARFALTRVFGQDGEALIALVVGYVQSGASERCAGGFRVMAVLVTAIHAVRRIERPQVSTIIPDLIHANGRGKRYKRVAP
jgi:hypothetical protein